MPNIREYSRRNDGDKKASENFYLREFACKDGSDYFKIDNDLFPIIQRFRQYVESPVTISSAYRNENYNKQVGGASGSYHVKGQAIDVLFNSNFKYLKSPYKMAEFFNTLKVPSIILYDWGVHIDTRDYINHIEKINNGYKDITINKINIPLYNLLQKGSNNNEVGCLQFMLQKIGYNIEVDEKFGVITEEKVKDFQIKNNLINDGIVGNLTWNKLIN